MGLWREDESIVNKASEGGVVFLLVVWEASLLLNSESLVSQ